MTTPYLVGDIKRDEGCRLTAYPDPVSGGEPWTIGFGHAGVDPHTVWTMAQAEDALSTDIGKTIHGLDVALPWWRTLDDIRQDVLVNMAFNLGVAGLATFKHTLEFVEAHEWKAAAEGMLNSKWARQVGERATRLAAQMRTGARGT